ncbi:hypothetical protein JMUB4039_1184 [Leptotrichia trevisanii]|uniref:hypothetical protein n=1 Tax=Leptotrichia trevisanii TaxID=109328 RepID=UPI00118ADEEE|nr:hypothetical protein [Leptotrichia trevisanii]BBM57206.1 hypothetical protein JMUB4039_1184 [Leptotrichia trevisanii]
MNNNFVPTRNRKEKEDIKGKRKEESEEQLKEQLRIYEKELREKILSDYEKNANFKKIFDEIEKNKEDKKKVLNLAQFNRFYNFVKENDYDFFDAEDKLKKFIEKQLERKYAVKFYIFIWNEFCCQISKGKLKNEMKIEKKKIGEFEVENLVVDNVKSIKSDEILKKEIKEETEVRLKIIEGYLLYILGKKRIDEKMKKIEGVINCSTAWLFPN